MPTIERDVQRLNENNMQVVRECRIVGINKAIETTFQ